VSRDEGAEIETRREIPAPREPAQPETGPASTAFAPAGERFELGEELGRGGMGRVVAATDRALAREVAIKQVLTDDAVQLARFEREVRITARLEHPSIVPIHDSGRDHHGRPFYVMRRLDGEHLSDRVAAATSPRERLALVPNVLAAVDAAAFAHARAIIHRDIKPWNILVGGYGETLLIDWGLARALDEAELPASDAPPSDDAALTRAGNVFGTPGYMAPEQARGEPADQRADVYALGATLLHVLTGKAALGGTSATEWLARATRGSALPIAELPPEIPRELIAIVGKAMAERREDRYRDAGELAADLRAFLAGQLVAAHRYTRRERLFRFVRRNRVALAIAVAALVAVAAIATISIRNVVDERDLARGAREDAERERATALAERAIATDRAEVILLDRASTLTATDPTRALALLRQIATTSPHVARARDIAEIAAHRGIAHGLATTLDSVNVLEFTPDGRTLIAAGESDDVWVIDVATGNHRTIAASTQSSHGLLLDPDHLVLAGNRRGLFLLDLRTGINDVLVASSGVRALWKVDTDRFRYHDQSARAVVERTRGGAERVLAREVRGALSFGEHLVYGDGKVLRLLVDGKRLVELAGSASHGDAALAASNRAGDRVAVAALDEVTEWDLTGHQTQRWATKQVSSLVYGDNGVLYASTFAGAVLTLGPAGPRELRRNNGAPWWYAPLAGGAAFLDEDGQITTVFGVHALSYPLDHARSRTLSVSPDRRHLAAGAADGTVRWIDLALTSPELYATPVNVQACWVDEREVILLREGKVLALERATSRVRQIASYPVGLPLSCFGRIGDALYLSSATGTVVLDLVRGDYYTVPQYGMADRYTQRLMFPQGAVLLEHDPALRATAPLFTASSTIDLYATFGRWAAAATGSTLYRYDRDTKQLVELPARGVEMIALRRTGEVGYTLPRELRIWDGVTTRRAFALPPGKVTALLDAPGGWSLQLQDGSLWFAGSEGLVQRVPANRVKFLGFGPGDLAWRLSTYKRLFRMHLRSGEQLVLDLPIHLLTRAGDRLTVGTGEDFVAVFEDRTPADPAELPAWIDRTTNAYLDASSALRWRSQVLP